MKSKSRSGSEGAEHQFGGEWTREKLAILERYLAAYTTALKNQKFKTAYIDAFAGTGYQTFGPTETEGTTLFPDLAAPATQSLLEGSARIALRVDPPFSRYIFIDKDAKRCEQLELLKTEFSEHAQSILIKQGEANEVLRDLCSKKWKARRAVLFLDPYGMQVEWETIEAIAKTEAIDLWLLFPLGIGVNRLLPRSGEIPVGWKNRLNLLLGTSDWEREFYETKTTINLFGEEITETTKVGMEAIAHYFINRLRSVFPGVADKPRVLMNSAKCPLYLLCFAVSSKNLKAKTTALKIADHLLRSF